MSELNKDGLYHIKVVNKVDNSVWVHKRVPYEHMECLKLSPNLNVEVVRMVGAEFDGRTHRTLPSGSFNKSKRFR
jgi:hypothetical protein